ncbi:MAG: terminase [Desulfobacterales bacterium]|nr:terminase [Desulfobacterales bacterium]
MIVNVKKFPKWMPKSYIQLILDNGPVHTFSFSSAEKKMMRKKTMVRPSVWQEKYRVLPDSSDLAGPMKNLFTPYMVGIIDAADFPGVETTILCKCVQSGGTENFHSLMGCMADRGPGNILYVYPNKDAGKKQLKTRILPMFKASSNLKKYLTGSVNDENNLGIRLKHLDIDIAWAHSPASLASAAYRYVVFDETDKYPQTAAKNETDTISLGEKRTTTFKRRNRAKIIKLSTPTTETGFIWEALTVEAQVIFDYFAKCPFCEDYQVMSIDNCRWEGGLKADYRKIESEYLAHYECRFCESAWNDDVRNKAVRAGEWRSRGKEIELFTYLKSFKPKKIGFHVPSWISFFVPISETVARYIKAENGGPEEKQDYANNYEAKPYKQIIVTSDNVTILKAKTPLPPQTIPQEAVAVTAAVDVQKRGFWYLVRAWAPNYHSWLIDYGDLGTWGDVENLFFDTAYPVQDSKEMLPIWRGGVDTGGGRYDSGQSMTEATLLWLQKVKGWNGPRIWGMKGASRPQEKKVKRGAELKSTPSGKPLKNGFRLYFLDTNRFKDIVYDRLGNAVKQEGIAAYLHSKVDDDYAKQILAEEKQLQKNGAEEWVQLKRDNHYLDCECMNAALSDWEWPGGGVNLLKPRIKKASTKKKINTVRSKFMGG